MHQIQCGRFVSPRIVSQESFLMFSTGSVFPLHRNRHHDTNLSVLHRGCRSTRLRPSWNSLLTLLTMCLPKLTPRLAFHTCFCRVWPTCPVHDLQADMCKSTCELHRRNVISTHSHVAISNGSSARFSASRPVIIVDTSIYNPSDGGMGEKTSSGSRRSSLSLTLLDFSTDQSRTTFLAFHLVYPISA